MLENFIYGQIPVKTQYSSSDTILKTNGLNIKKRQVKAPKIYIRDSGILHTLLRLYTWCVLLPALFLFITSPIISPLVYRYIVLETKVQMTY
jgi:hypothetical protein